MKSNKTPWETTYSKNIGKMVGICYRYVLNKPIAEDLAHDAFISALEKFDTYRGEGCINAWLRRIAINTALQYLRKKNTNLFFEDLELHEHKFMEKYHEENTSTQIQNADFSKEELLRAISQLPEHHKLVFNLYVIDGYTHYQIGKELGISPGTSKSHLARARKNLQKTLTEKALEKQRKKDWKRALFILIFPGKPKSIEQLYQTQFDNFSIQPQKLLKTSHINFGKPAASIGKATLTSSKGLSIAFISVAVAGFMYFVFIEKQNSQSFKPKILTDTLEEPTQNTDTTAFIAPSEIASEKINIEIDKKIEATVVIKKKLIKHNPIIIKRPLIVKDTTHEK